MQAVRQSVIAVLGMGAALWAWLAFTPTLPAPVIALGGVALGGGVYLLLLVVMGVREVRMVWTLRKSLLQRIVPARK